MARKRSKNRAGIFAIAAVAAAGVIVLSMVVQMITSYFYDVPAGTLKVHIIDVGNADAILLTCDDRSMLIDAGENPDGDNIVAYLRSNGVEKLDFLVATHPDADHIGGMDVVINNIFVDTFIMPIMPEKSTPTTQTYMDLLYAADKNGLEIIEPVPGMNWELGAAHVTILAPVGTFDDTNDMSVVLKVVNGRNKFLFMGDAEKAAEEALLASGADLDADFIKVGHHGSKTSTGLRLLEAVNPRYAAITCGEKNRYGHPHIDTMKKLQDFDVEVFRSDINGNIVVSSDGDVIAVAVQR